MKQLKALINYVKDYKNDLQGYSRDLLVHNLQSIEIRQRERTLLLEKILEDFEYGNISQAVINDIKIELENN